VAQPSKQNITCSVAPTPLWPPSGVPPVAVQRPSPYTKARLPDHRLIARLVFLGALVSLFVFSIGVVCPILSPTGTAEHEHPVPGPCDGPSLCCPHAGGELAATPGSQLPALARLVEMPQPVSLDALPLPAVTPSLVEAYIAIPLPPPRSSI